MNCIDNACKNLYEICGEDYCAITKQKTPDNIDETQCDKFVQAKTCLNCRHSLQTVYETGTIDDIEYRCPFQNKELIYDDSVAPLGDHFYDVPDCNIDKFEEMDCYKGK